MLTWLDSMVIKLFSRNGEVADGHWGCNQRCFKVVYHQSLNDSIRLPAPVFKIRLDVSVDNMVLVADATIESNGMLIDFDIGFEPKHRE